MAYVNKLNGLGELAGRKQRRRWQIAAGILGAGAIAYGTHKVGLWGSSGSAPPGPVIRIPKKYAVGPPTPQIQKGTGGTSPGILKNLLSTLPNLVSSYQAPPGVPMTQIPQETFTQKLIRFDTSTMLMIGVPLILLTGFIAIRKKQQARSKSFIDKLTGR